MCVCARVLRPVPSLLALYVGVYIAVSVLMIGDTLEMQLSEKMIHRQILTVQDRTTLCSHARLHNLLPQNVGRRQRVCIIVLGVAVVVPCVVHLLDGEVLEPFQTPAIQWLLRLEHVVCVVPHLVQALCMSLWSHVHL